ncbi:MAG: thioredoxin-disulfide reductase [Deltaproteobacteria bacterium]|uniref:Thioredoxin reductase n=1 Tax=Candidatus Desulfacyla euxinica TaxID=2841693 RepID=A0A8J6T8W1_9DELT|nr:thioredoxin-disulfide reductase [Candidatus Desulfacyla euxinica]MBL7216601.1 thioredoxin-disulfide reductase [Desulfobacteraceae bacterium]
MADANNDNFSEFHDLIIIGAGPAGLSAGLYAARNKQDVVLVEKLSPGGQVLTTDLVENYPGFPDGIGGFELMDSIGKQAERFGLKILSHEVQGVDFKNQMKHLTLAYGSMEARSVIVTTGAQPRKLGIEGEELLTGKGVSYCGTCDGPFYREADIAIIGGGDTAVQEAVFLTRFASRVYVIHRRDELRATKIIQERAFANEKIEFIWDTIPLSIEGETGVERLRLRNVKTSKESTLNIEGVFVLVGTRPVTEFLEDAVDMDNQGFINVDRRQETNVQGVFAAGDVTSETPRQIATAVGEGVTAVLSAEEYLEDQA